MLMSCRAKVYLCCVREVLRTQLDSTSASHDGALHQLWTCHATEHAQAEDRSLARDILSNGDNVICLLSSTAEFSNRPSPCHRAQQSNPLPRNCRPAIQHAPWTRRRESSLASSAGDRLFICHCNTPRLRTSYIVPFPEWHQG